MSRPLPPEPPAKRQRAQGDGEEGTGGSGGLDEEQEYQRLAAVSLIQDELNALGEEEAQQVLQVHKAFLKRKRPLYVKRQEAIAEVPDFWLKVLLAHPLTQPYISDGDQLALSYLESVTVSKAKSTAAAAAAATAAIDGDDDDSKARQEGTAPETDVPKKMVAGEREAHLGGAGANELDDDDDVGFRVTFKFRENPFFSNAELWREWDSAEGQAAFSAISWKDTEESKDRQAHLLWNLDPAAAEDGETPSFFSIFCNEMEEDYELGEALRGDITDNPLEIYMRHDFEAEAEEEDEEEDGEEGDGAEEEQYEDGDDLQHGAEAPPL